MKRMISSHKETYGKTYGILVIIALLYFFLIGAAWFGIFMYLGKFVLEGFIMMIVFGFQLFYRRKIVTLVLGILAMFFSILQLLDTLKLYPRLNNPIYYELYVANLIIFTIAIIMSGILIFSFMYAFKQQEDNY